MILNQDSIMDKNLIYNYADIPEKHLYSYSVFASFSGEMKVFYPPMGSQRIPGTHVPYPFELDDDENNYMNANVYTSVLGKGEYKTLPAVKGFATLTLDVVVNPAALIDNNIQVRFNPIFSLQQYGIRIELLDGFIGNKLRVNIFNNNPYHGFSLKTGDELGFLQFETLEL